MSFYWKDYRKEIAGNDFFFMRSCIRQTFFPGAENILLDILRNRLHLNVVEDPDHTTCTGIGFHTDIVPLETSMTVIARHFALMKSHNLNNMLLSCVTSFGLYAEILDLWKHHPQKKKEIEDILFESTGRSFVEPDNLIHSSDILYRYRAELARMTSYTLTNCLTNRPLKVVDHVGCHYAKIFRERGVGGAEFPQVLAELVSAFGGELIDYPERRHCCGFGFRHYLLQSNRGYSLSHSKIKLESMKPFMPDLIVANCPGCAMFLDRWQYTIEQMEGSVYGAENLKIPVLSHEELVALMLGYYPWDIGLQTHQVDVEPLLDKLGIPYDPEGKRSDVMVNLTARPCYIT